MVKTSRARCQQWFWAADRNSTGPWPVCLPPVGAPRNCWEKQIRATLPGLWDVLTGAWYGAGGCPGPCYRLPGVPSSGFWPGLSQNLPFPRLPLVVAVGVAVVGVPASA